MAKPSITVQDVSKHFRLERDQPDSLKARLLRRGRGRYEEFWALRDVSFEVPRGAMFGVIGHNGSGKSTLLRLMARIYRPTAGEVVTRGRVSALLELGTGFHPDLSGRENVYLNASILGIGRRQIEGIVDEIIDFSGIGSFIDTPVRVYSSGMKVRLGFSVAVHVNPEILLLDEVVAVGDEEFKRRCFEHLYTLRNEGVTVVLVTHSLGQVQSLCDQAVWLDHGRIRADGEATDVARQYLSEVNQLEAEANSRDGGDRGERRGSGEATVEGVSFLNEDGLAVPYATSGAPVTTRLRHRVHERVERVRFGIRLHTPNDGRLVTQTVSRPFTLEPTTGDDEIVDFRLTRMPLTPGTYHLTVGIYDENQLHVFDEREREFEFIVQPGPARSTVGVLDIGGGWSLAPDQATQPTP